jgi:hypothetical protein
MAVIFFDFLVSVECAVWYLWGCFGGWCCVRGLQMCVQGDVHKKKKKKTRTTRILKHTFFFLLLLFFLQKN